VVLAGCATLEPEALQPAEIAAITQAGRAELTKDVEPLTGPLTLEEAIARSIKYNAAQRLKAIEQAVAMGTFEAGKFDMLPKLVASAGYRYRDKELITRSEDSVTGLPSLANPFISTDRKAFGTDLSFSWSLLDFGQSYYAAKQNADRALVAAERRRKAIHMLIQDVRTAYWRVVAADKLGGSVREAVKQAETALADARKVETQKLRSPLVPLRYQLQLLENLRLLEVIQDEFSTARVELAALVNLPLSKAIQVQEPHATVNTAWLDTPIARMEEHALMFNPDLHESMYNVRIARQETHRALLKLFPGLSFNYAVRESDDRFLINQHWREAGAQISFNLLGLLAAPAQIHLAESGLALAEQNRLATQMAVLTQLHIARLHYANAVDQYERADSIATVNDRITTHVVNQERAQTQTRLARVSQQTASILSTLRRYQALSNAQAAGSRLQATLGLEPAVEGSDSMPLKDLTAAVRHSLDAWESGRLPPLPGAVNASSKGS
jgi:outer membrane protein TolC